MVVCVDHGGDCVFDVLPVVWAAVGAVRWSGLAFAGGFGALDMGFTPPWLTWRRNWSDGSVIGCKPLIFSGLGGVIGGNDLRFGWLVAGKCLASFLEKITPHTI